MNAPAPGFQKRDPMTQPEACFWAVALIGGEVSTSQVGDWLRQEGVRITNTNVHSRLVAASRRQPPLIELAHRGTSRVDPDLWRLTANGHDYLATFG
jgi:hypothetical protein